MKKIPLKAARVAAGFSQTEAAAKLKTTKFSIINYEKGRTSPTVDLADRMAKLYGFKMEEIDFFIPQKST